MQYFNQLVLLGIILGVTGCGNDDLKHDKELKSIIKAKQLTGNPFKGKNLPNIMDAKSQLGMHLFFSKSLGVNRDSACVTCHHPMLGGGDDLSLPIGVGAVNPDLLGKGRLHSSLASSYNGGPLVPRNAPTTFNIAGWNKVLFHDGRIETLSPSSISTPDSGYLVEDLLATKNLASAQSRFPITSLEEMKGFASSDKTNNDTRRYVASRIGGYGEGRGELEYTNYWLTKFQIAFNKPKGLPEELITEQNIALLLGEYENSQVFIDTPWKDYIEGDDFAISSFAKEGALLFFKSKEEGGVNCVSCHKGDFFTDESFHNIAMPQFGQGKGNGDDGVEDFGRFLVTEKEPDKYAFRTPTLLNVEMTGPWGHTGAYTSLESIVRHHLNPKLAIENYDFKQLFQPGLQHLDKLKENTLKAISLLEEDQKLGKKTLSNMKLNDKEVKSLVAFLETLTDSCVKDKECLSKWVPFAQEDPNGDQLDAVNKEGTPLALN